jgi:hypothetical protein
MKGTILHFSPPRKRKQLQSAHEPLMSSSEPLHSPKPAANSRLNSKRHRSLKNSHQQFSHDDLQTNIAQETMGEKSGQDDRNGRSGILTVPSLQYSSAHDYVTPLQTWW